MQDAAANNQGTAKYDFGTILNDENSCFSYSDLTADIDGLFIGNKAKNLSLENSIRTYYEEMSYSPGTYRYASFVGHLGYEFDNNYDSIISGFEKEIFEYLALDLSDNGTCIDIAIPYMGSLKYAILDKNSQRPSIRYRYMIAKSFIEYILKSANLREEILLDEFL